MNSKKKSFRSNYLCFHAELKYMSSKLRVLSDPKRPSLLHLTEKHAQSIRSLCSNVLAPFTLTQCEIKARKVQPPH